MAMEIWILLAVVVAGLALVIGLRLRGGRRPAASETKSLYPLW
jgi:hypothetical protein